MNPKPNQVSVDTQMDCAQTPIAPPRAVVCNEATTHLSPHPVTIPVDHSSSGPLPFDPRRQACDSIRGYLYQIWISVHAWLELGEKEILYLECAEDIDRLYPGGADIIQIKDQAANVTLRSAGIVAAISNYWLLKQKSPDIALRFRFLTTAQAGVEQGEPFGEGIQGLSVWHDSRRDQKKRDLLIAFLRTHDALPEGVCEFVRKSDAESVQRTLLDPIVWELDQGDASYVVSEVERKLVSLGQSYGVLPESSKRVAARLLKAAFDTASTRKGQPLTQQQLLELFQEETTERVPRDQLTGLRLLQQQLTTGMITSSAPGAAIPLNPLSRIQRTIPALPATMLSRDVLVTDCSHVLDRSGFLVLTGSMGMGKTTLAKLVSAQSAGWIWVHLASLTPETIVDIMARLGGLMDSNPSIKNLLFDDIDLSPAACRLYEPFLGGILVTAQSRAGKVILTSQRSPSSRLQSALSMQATSLVRVPTLTEEEVSSILATAGFPRSPEERLQWSKIIRLHSSGHPQLVQAAIRSQILAGWPRPRMETLLETPQEVAVEKRETRQMLVDALSAPQRKLAYWLGMVGIFRRDQAIAIGERAGISTPGDEFEQLVGPWVEPITEDYFRVTPLIGSSATDVFGKQEIQDVHGILAEALLSCGHMSQHEASSIIMHALAGKHVRILLLSVYRMVMGADEPTRDIVLKDLSWFLAFSTEPGVWIYPDDPHVNSALRMLQFRVALVTDPSKAHTIAERWDEQITDSEPREIFLLQRFTYVLHMLLFFQAPISPTRLIACFKELEDLREAWPEMAEQLAKLKIPPTGEFPELEDTDAASLFFAFTTFRCDSPDFLRSLMSELETVQTQLRKRMTSKLAKSISASTMLIDRTWLAVARHEKPDWTDCLDAFRDARTKANRMEMPHLAHAATRGIGIIFDEYLDAPDRAIDEIAKAEIELGDSPILQDERATILYHHKEYGSALDIWQRVLTESVHQPEEYDITIWTRRKAGISAAMVGKWSLAANLFAQGSDRARTTDVGWATAGLLADAAFAHWKCGENSQLVKSLRASLEVLGQLPDAKQNFSTFALGKGIGCILVWIKNELRGDRSPDHGEPYAGMCSNPEPNDRLRELPMTLTEICWIMLADIEFDLALGTEIYDLVCARFSQSTRAMAQVLLVSLRLSFCTKHGRYADILQLAFTLVRTMSRTRTSIDVGHPIDATITPAAYSAPLIPEETDIVTHTLTTALICAAVHRNEEKAIGYWRTTVESDGRFRPVGPFLECANSYLRLDLNTARKQMRQRNAGWQPQTLAALRLTANEDTSPEDMFQAHIFLLGCIRTSLIKNAAAHELAALIERNWRHLIRFPVQLRTPMTTVPAITNACGSPASGIRKLALILLAASTAINTPVPAEVIRDLENLRDADVFPRSKLNV